ncbi:MAG: hypothetical protein FWH20_03905 [Oscillospiraceae bacterium]|nr:hypothetical protein [Oscillospiraceae bacterium]
MAAELNYRADICTKEQLSAALAIGEFERIYAPMELLNVGTTALGRPSIGPRNPDRTTITPPVADRPTITPTAADRPPITPPAPDRPTITPTVADRPTITSTAPANPPITPNNLSRIIAVPPIFIGGNEPLIAAKLRELRELGFTSGLAHTLGHIELIKSAGLKPHGGFRLNIVNARALEIYREMGVCDLIYSVEMPLRSITASNCNCQTGIIAYGQLPLMLLRRCAVQDSPHCGKAGCDSLTDRLGNNLQTLCRWGETEVLNPVPLVLSDKLGDVANVDFAVLKFAPGENIADILDKYRRATPAGKKFTRGLYYKRVR